MSYGSAVYGTDAYAGSSTTPVGSSRVVRWGVLELPVVDPSPGVVVPVYDPPTYHFIARDRETLNVLGFVSHFGRASWNRRLYSLGQWELSGVLFDDFAINWAEGEGILEIVRNGVQEFVGLVEDYEFSEEANTLGRIWGQDAKKWLENRTVWPPPLEEVDHQSGVASQVIRNYVLNSLTQPTDASRDVDAELGTNVQGQAVTFFVPNESLGNVVTFDERYSSLLDVAFSAAREGEIWFEVVLGRSNPAFEYDRWEVNFHEYVDRSEGEVDQVVWSVNMGTALSMTVRSSRSSYANAVTVLGQGEGETQTTYRAFALGESAWRRETVTQLRDAQTSAILEFVDNPSNGQTVTVGSRTYTFVNAFTAPDQVLIAANVEDSLYRLALALGNAGGAGVLYSAGTTAHADVWARQDSKRMTVTLFGSASANSTISLSTTVTNAAWDHASISYEPLVTEAARLQKEHDTRVRSYTIVPHPSKMPYREAWDLGYFVTVRSDRLETSDVKLVTDVSVTFSESSGEQVTIKVGEPPLSVLAALKKEAKK